MPGCSIRPELRKDRHRNRRGIKPLKRGPEHRMVGHVFEPAKSPVVLHFIDLPMPLRLPLWLQVKLTGMPVKKLVIPLSCQPPKPFFRKRLNCL